MRGDRLFFFVSHRRAMRAAYDDGSVTVQLTGQQSFAQKNFVVAVPDRYAPRSNWTAIASIDTRRHLRDSARMHTLMPHADNIFKFCQLRTNRRLALVLKRLQVALRSTIAENAIPLFVVMSRYGHRLYLPYEMRQMILQQLVVSTSAR